MSPGLYIFRCLFQLFCNVFQLLFTFVKDISRKDFFFLLFVFAIFVDFLTQFLSLDCFWLDMCFCFSPGFWSIVQIVDERGGFLATPGFQVLQIRG